MPRTKLAAIERQRFIMEWLSEHPSISITDVVSRYNVSEVTVRHDLIDLEQSGRVRRIRGGAVSLGRSMAVSYPEERACFNTDAKLLIGRKAAEYVSDGDVIICDIGTTNFYFVQQLSQKKDLTVITGDLAIANYISYNLPFAQVVLLGGMLQKGHLYSAGSLTLETMSKLYADKAFISTDGFDLDRGFTVEHDFSVSIKHRYAQNARQRFMLMDSSKVGKTSFYQFAHPADFDVLITETDPDDALADMLSYTHKSPELIVIDQQKV
ncbi:DeoR/GlpR family DNA-binding transcription regulator [Collinsella sp. zg1085]|uniref:DeoR/GlpR family DNA-binding transcription regulator n=1 Tax=Collinsella sp. zg1085 TaxID=2844380 RepID=UPI001C0B8C9A|nr:DeoR/GlpR family DNA-binding transcription regulator [Collinsella sp. zg1085]QWT17989.1 DeoR/GlpR family DNA-binding transcription regulator [Collinsella sp. zg1085]